MDKTVVVLSEHCSNKHDFFLKAAHLLSNCLHRVSISTMLFLSNGHEYLWSMVTVSGFERLRSYLTNTD